MSETNPIVAALQVAFEAAVQTAVEQRLAPLAARLAALEARASDLTPQLQRVIFSDDELRLLAAHVNLADLAGELIPAQLRTIGEGVNLASLAAELSPSDLISNVDWSEVLDYSDLASEIDLSDLADEISMERLTDAIDLNDKIRDYLSDTMFNIREA
jgi:hypothetical protein